jgi:hypothetical protein
VQFDARGGSAVVRVILIFGALIAAACQAHPGRPDFLARSNQDCMTGDRAACTMLAALRQPQHRDHRHDRLSAVAARAALANPDQPNQRPVRQDVEAIMEGINGARNSEPSLRSQKAPEEPSGGLDSP